MGFQNGKDDDIPATESFCGRLETWHPLGISCPAARTGAAKSVPKAQPVHCRVAPCYPNLQIDIHDGFFALSESTGEIWSDVFQSHHARLEHAALKSSKEALGSGNANHVDIMTNNEEIMI